MTASKIKIGVKEDGSPKVLRIDNLIRPELDKVKKLVKIKKYQYLAVVSGLSGTGKSTLARTLARYCCKWFDESLIAFTAEEFIRITNECPQYSSVILDESFESLNSNVGKSEEFLKILNHLQIIRQKNLFVFLCLPNFFDLSKNVAVFLTSHLYVTYSDEKGNRGRFLVFDRKSKKALYILGKKFLDYNCVKANFYAEFWENEDILNMEAYDKMKREHLLAQGKNIKTNKNKKWDRDWVLYRLHTERGWLIKEIAEFMKLSERQVYENFLKYKYEASNRRDVT